MRTLHLLVAALLLATSTTAQAESAASAIDREAVACQVTTLALKSIIPEHLWRLGQTEPNGREFWRTRLKTRFRANDGWFRPDPQTGQYIRTEAPSDAMIGAALATPPTNGVQCQQTRDLAATHGALGPETPEDRTLVKGLFKRTFIGIEKAVLSPDGDEAIVYYGRGLGLLNGSSHYLYFRKDADGSWRQIATLLASVS